MSRTSQVYIKAASTTVGKPSSLWSFRQGREAQTLVIFSTILEGSGGFEGKDWMVGLDLLKGEELLEPFLTRCSRNKTRQPVLGSFLGYQVSRHLQAEDSIVAAGAPQQKGSERNQDANKMQINFERICGDLLTLRYFPIAKQQNGWVQEDTTAGVRWRFQQASLGANGASQGPQEISYRAVKSCQKLSKSVNPKFVRNPHSFTRLSQCILQITGFCPRPRNVSWSWQKICQATWHWPRGLDQWEDWSLVRIAVRSSRRAAEASWTSRPVACPSGQNPQKWKHHPES